MTTGDERWFAEQRSVERARGRCAAALGVGVLSVLGVFLAVAAPDSGSAAVLCSVVGLLGAVSVGLVVLARPVSAWSRLGCGLPGSLTLLLMSLVGLIVLVDTL